MLMEYSIYDAVRAGFTKVVFIIKPDMRELMDRLWGDRTLITKTGEPLEVCYAMQDFTSIPDYYTIPAGRTKPFGTAHAVLCARPYLSEPFCVINADDYYGVDAYRAMYEELQRLPRQGRGHHGGVSAEKHRQRQRHRVPWRVPGGGRLAPRHP